MLVVTSSQGINTTIPQEEELFSTLRSPIIFVHMCRLHFSRFARRLHMLWYRNRNIAWRIRRVIGYRMHKYAGLQP